jgi:hypothetical protein
MVTAAHNMKAKLTVHTYNAPNFRRYSTFCQSDGSNCAAHSGEENNIFNASECESWNKLKLKLNEILSELSSTYAIIDLLQMEINSKHSRTSEGDNSRDMSTNNSKNQNNVK